MRAGSSATLRFAAALLGCMPLAYSASAGSLSAGLLGEVRSANGVAQMGATVLLYNRYDQLLRQALTNDQGRFAFDALTPDVYSVRVSLASFVPAMRRNISILAGTDNLLKISLASMLSSIELVPLASPSGTLMSDEWKWVLRASQATRPVLRLLPTDPSARRNAPPSSLFSGTTGVVRVSAGGNDPQSSVWQQELGTGFAVATSIRGGSQVRVSGNLGYTAVSGLPSAGFRATYSKDSDNLRGPQVAITARQLYLPAMAGSGTPGSVLGPALRTASMAATDKVDVTENLRVEYGVAMESITYQDRINYVSTFGRAAYSLGDNGTLQLAYSSAAEPSDLIAREETNTDLNQDLTVLARLPRITRRNGRTQVQRNQNLEAGYTIVDGSRTFSISAYREDVYNAAFLLSGALDLISTENMLPDLNSRGIIFNGGDFRRTGVSGAVTQRLGERVEITIAGGRNSTLIAGPLNNGGMGGEELRSAMHHALRPWVTMRAGGTIPKVGTHLSASYGWTDFRVLTPSHRSLTSKANQELGWNAGIRQPLPAFGGMRMEVSADLLNILAQGYLPIVSGERRAILTNAPRGLRGGVSFIF